MINEDPNSSLYGNFVKFVILNFSLLIKIRLCQILEVLPASSVDCERGFSTMNDIKTWDRNKLKTDHLGDLMRVSMSNITLKVLKPSGTWRYTNSRMEILKG